MKTRFENTLTVLSFTLASSLAISTSAMANEPSLTGTVWELQQIRYNDGTTLEANPPEDYTIEFMDDGTVGGKADCKGLTGTYTVDESQLSITLGPSITLLCSETSIESQYQQALSSVSIYFFQDGDLYLDLTADAGTMQFSPADASDDVSDNDSELVEPIPALW